MLGQLSVSQIVKLPKISNYIDMTHHGVNLVAQPNLYSNNHAFDNQSSRNISEGSELIGRFFPSIGGCIMYGAVVTL